jgi:hypothetical protein
VGTGKRVEQRERGASDSAAARQRGKRREKGGGPRRGGVPRGAGVPWGLAPTGSHRPTAARARRLRMTCAARACRPDRAVRERADRWAATQYQAAVPLIGGAGPRRKRGGRAQMNSKVLHLFELV